MKRRFGPLAAACVLGACAHAPPPAEGGTADLRFGWEPGLRADAALSKTITRLDDPNLTRSARARAAFLPEPFGDLVLVRVAADRPALVGTPLVDFVVTPEGRFVGILDPDELQARVEMLLEDTTPDADLDFELHELMAPEPELNARVEDLWNLAVGAWVGLGVQRGATSSGSAEVQAGGAAADQSYRLESQASLRRTVPCARGGVERVCAELEYRALVDAQDALRVMGVVLRRSAAPGEQPEGTLRAVDVAVSLNARTELAGLVPHEATMTKSVRVTFEEAEHPVEQIETLRAVYAYEY